VNLSTVLCCPQEDAERRAVLAKAEAERAAKELSNWQQSAERSSSQVCAWNEI
jgi:hypothetical protein